MAGTGTMSPAASGGLPGPSIAQPLPYTWLSLHRYAKIVNINPVHFWGGVGTTTWPLSGNACNDIWPRHSWQWGSQISLEELAYAIRDAEDTIANFVGYPLAPTFYSEESHQYPRFYNKDYLSLGGLNRTGGRRSVSTNWKKVISPGRRATTLIESGVTVSYSDEDGDGFSETATITVTTSADPCEVKAYYLGTGADPRWEIREASSKVTSGATVVMKFDSWLFIDPDLAGAAPDTDGYTAIDVTTTTNYVATVDVYREYADTTAVASQFSWLCSSCGVANCTVCGATNQNGCLVVKNSETGHVVPSPATYNSGWTLNSWTKSESPQYVNVWYQAGDRSREFMSGLTCDPLSDFWATQIVRLATARLYKPFCQCGNITAFAKDMQIELTRQGEEGGHLFDFTSISNPFGTRKGEYMVYKSVALGNQRKISSGAVR